MPKYDLPGMSRNLSIRVKIWLFFMMLICVVFILMWTFQVLFLGQFYEVMKVSSVARATGRLAETYQTEAFADNITDTAMRNDMCIEVLNADGTEMGYQCVFSGNCLLHNGSNDLYFFFMDLQQSENGEICRKLYNETMQINMLVYGCPVYGESGSLDGISSLTQDSFRYRPQDRYSSSLLWV